MRLRGVKKWWRLAVRPWTVRYRTLILAAGPVAGALLGVVTNLITGTWNWWLFAAMLVLMVVLTLQAVLIEAGEPGSRLLPPDMLSTALRRFEGSLFGRGRPFHELVHALHHDDGKRIHVVHGLAGTGTTALASRFGIRAENDGAEVFWVDGSTATTLQGGFQAVHARVARLAGDLPVGTGPLDIDGLWDRLGWLSVRTPWLLIIDGLDDVQLLGSGADLRSLHGRLRIPPPGCAVVITTTDGRTVHFSRAAVRFRRLGGLAAAPGGRMLVDHAPHAGPRHEAERLSARLGGNAMALFLAGRYLAVAAQDHLEPSTFAGYHAAIGSPTWWNRLTAKSGHLWPVVAAWERSLGRIEAGHPGAGLLLGVIACVSTEPIPRIMIEEQVLRESDLFGRSFPLWRALERLADFGMVELIGQGDEQLVIVHPLVQALIRRRREIRRRAAAVRRLAKRLKSFPEDRAPEPVRSAVRRARVVDVPDEDQPGEAWWDRFLPTPAAHDPSTPSRLHIFVASPGDPGSAPAPAPGPVEPDASHPDTPPVATPDDLAPTAPAVAVPAPRPPHQYTPAPATVNGSAPGMPAPPIWAPRSPAGGGTSPGMPAPPVSGPQPPMPPPSILAVPLSFQGGDFDTWDPAPPVDTPADRHVPPPRFDEPGIEYPEGPGIGGPGLF
ncbi:hypothetical protein ACQP2F_30220 [Actinoplanes sp. CA-030573]|uniref:hypothetical protein n=1 Tax=Actinoplanes sp. CA-030573 TaxID=3239898 RepID=UPI003D92D104